MHKELGYEPIVVLGNSEFEITGGNSTLLNMEDSIKTGAEDEDIQKVRNKISLIEEELQGILYNASLSMNEAMTEDKLVKINNVVQELEKATINLGTAVNTRDDTMPEN